MSIDINSILKELRQNADMEGRKEPGERFLVPRGKAWYARRRKERELVEKEIDQLHGRKRAQARYHAKNRERLNRRRAERARLPKQVYKRTKKKALQLEQEWKFTFDSWWEKWQNAPLVLDPGTGFNVSAWQRRGRDYNKHTQLTRIGNRGEWSPENTEITLAGVVLK
jgi:hypothetical protein